MPTPENAAPTRAERAATLRAIRSELDDLQNRTRDALRGLRGGDMCILAHPVKAPFLEWRDSLTDLADEIEAGKWDDDVLEEAAR